MNQISGFRQMRCRIIYQTNTSHIQDMVLAREIDRLGRPVRVDTSRFVQPNRKGRNG